MIPISAPVMGTNAKKYVMACVSTGWVSSKGTFVERFENAFARFIGTPYAVACSSGTAAIHLSLAALGIGKGDEVIIPTLTMIATALPIIYQGATPVLVDSEPTTGNINVKHIQAAITNHTRAIIAVHLHGQPADMQRISAIAKKYHLALIEDAAEAHGAKIRNRRVGSFGDMGCFSFYGNKIITTGEGGMVTTNNKRLADKLRLLRNLARTPGKHFLHSEVAYAYRMSNLEAALGLAQTEEAQRFVEKKRHIAAFYSRHLTHVQLPEEVAGTTSVFWQYGILLSSAAIRTKLAAALARHGIETRNFFTPMHTQPALAPFITKGTYKVADDLSKRGLCLPSGLTITDRQLIAVCKNVNRLLS